MLDSAPKNPEQLLHIFMSTVKAEVSTSVTHTCTHYEKNSLLDYERHCYTIYSILRCFVSNDVNLLASAFTVYMRPLVEYCSIVCSVVNKDFVHKDQDQDKDLPLKDQDKDKDLSVKDKDKDKDLSKYSIKDHLERYLYGAEISMF